MKNIRIVFALLIMSLSIPLTTFAAVSSSGLSSSTPLPTFTFSCTPYQDSFISGNYYSPADPGGCVYGLPALNGPKRFLAVYKGTIGNAVLETYDFYDQAAIPQNTVNTSPDNFNGTQNDDFFTVALGYATQDELINVDTYFRTGVGTVPTSFASIAWKWGVAPITDTIPPSVTINTPFNGSSYLQNDNLFVMASTSDDTSVASTTYTLNGNPIDPTLPLPLSGLPLGSEKLVVDATDPFGNTGYATSTFTLLAPDVTAPAITITNPVQGASYFDSASVLVNATVTDASPIVSTSYSFNGSTINRAQPLPLLGAPLGPAIVSVTATDKYGNVGNASVTFTIKSSDVTPPTITISNPVAAHTYLSTDTVLAQATASDASGVHSITYALNGTPIDPTVALPLGTVSGTTTLVVTAADNFGNVGSSSVSFKVITPPPPDVTPPTITISSPVQGKRYDRDDKVFLTATVTDASGIASTQYFFNGKLIDPSKPLPFSTVHVGSASTTVIAIDKFGNKATATVTFRVLPSVGNECFEDITDAFNHKSITDKMTFLRLFKDCVDRDKYQSDRDNVKNDDDKKHQNYQLDSHYVKADQQYSSIQNDIDVGIGN